MAQRPLNVLFLCTGNSCRSIIAEALLNHLGRGRFRGFSAGSHPAGRVNPNAVEALARAGIDAQGLRSKPWDEFAAPQAPVMDMVITVCDNAAGEVCPAWPGRPAAAHWGVPDPALFRGGEKETAAVFDETKRLLEARIAALVALPPSAFAPPGLENQLAAIGRGQDP